MKVTLLAHTNNGADICNIAAKTCYSAQPPSEIHSNNYASLAHAVSSGHTSVLEHCVFTFAVEGISRACSHQLVRHRFISPSQKSQRYVKMSRFDYVIPDSIRNSKVEVFHGIDVDDSEISVTMQEEYENLMNDIASLYEFMVDNGIPNEDARMILPNACTTDMVITVNARELLHFFALRTCTRAQSEIRMLADSMLKICKEVEPEIFRNAGPSCVQIGVCPEIKSCGRCKTISELTGGN